MGVTGQQATLPLRAAGERSSFPLRTYSKAGCSTCASIGAGIGPPHEASDRCASGGHDHCTCDTCF